MWNQRTVVKKVERLAASAEGAKKELLRALDHWGGELFWKKGTMEAERSEGEKRGKWGKSLIG